jgi:hypothetical protein
MHLSFFSRLKPQHEPLSERAMAAARGRVDDRRYLRSPITAPVIVSWQDPHGQPRYTEAQGMNMSSAGALVRSLEPVPVGAAVYMESKPMRLMANAVVRHCTGQKTKFLIGLEFRGSLTRSL